MADKNKRITDVDFIESLNSDESFFINQHNAIKQIKRNNVVFDIANGGTGATTVADARNNLGLGNTDGALPVANGGTGALDAATARANLGITPKNIGAVTMESTSANLSPNDSWVDNKQTINVYGVTSNNTVVVSPEPSIDNYNAYNECAIRCISQSDGKLTFLCESVPNVAVVVDILIFV